MKFDESKIGGKSREKFESVAEDVIDLVYRVKFEKF